MKLLHTILGSIVILVFYFIACSPEDNETSVRIRLKNSSTYTMTDILVNTSGGQQFYGDLEPNQKTVYKIFEFAYSYAFVELKIYNRTYTLQPIDYVGETVLQDGNYTYEIYANESGNQYDKLSIKLIQD